MTDEEYYDIISGDDEEWRQVILDHKLIDYDVSTYGNVRRHDSKEPVKLIRYIGVKNHYNFVYLRLGNGRVYNTGVHRLMGMMFIPIPEKYIKQGLHSRDLVIDHIDDVKYHNVISNLQWLTHKENTGKSHPYLSSKLSDETVHTICKKLVAGEPIYTIADDMNVTELQVCGIRYNHHYSDISSQYTFPRKNITENTARIICEYLSKGYSASKTAKLLGLTKATCEGILVGATWKHVSKDYTFPKKRVEKAVVRAICEMLQDGYNKHQISDKLGVRLKIVEKIAYRESHTDISDHYDFTLSPFKVSDEVVHSICKDLLAAQEKNYTMKDIAKRNNVSLTFVKDLKYGHSRRIITSEYGLC